MFRDNAQGYGLASARELKPLLSAMTGSSSAQTFSHGYAELRAADLIREEEMVRSTFAKDDALFFSTQH